MALDEMKYHLSEMDKHVRAYVDDSLDFAELKGFKYSMVLVTYMAKMLILSIIILLALLVLSIYAALYLSEQMGNSYEGFLIMGFVYVLVGVIFYLLRNKLDKPILRIFSKRYFNKT